MSSEAPTPTPAPPEAPPTLASLQGRIVTLEATIKAMSTRLAPTTNEETSVSGAAKNGAAAPVTITDTRSPALSDAAAAGLFAIGLILIVAGAFYSRITSIKGAGIEVTCSALAGAARAAVEQQAPAGTTPEMIAAATTDATTRLAELGETQRITEELLMSVAQSSLDRVT